ncbi:MAG: hypothetical protein H6Q89_3824 [Myxococcaceae bacterium]|nr:hypothetical protein [Myxococcaceae bacterium]
MMTFWRVGLSAVAVATMVGCSGGGVPAACDKSEAIDLNAKAGDCTGLDLSKPYGTRAVCAEKLKACTTAETDTLATIVTCLENLPTCSAAARATFFNRQAACYASVSGLSMGCKVAVFGTTPFPGEDGGFDAGPPPDAGRQPSDGTGVVELIAVADESGFAFAWSSGQSGPVVKWELTGFGAGAADGGRLPEIYISPGSARAYELAAPKPDGGTDAGGPMLARQYFVAGVDNLGHQVFGAPPDAGTPVVPDAGGCTNAIDCPPEKVCDLGACKTQSCQAGGPVTCPFGYTCEPGPMACQRQFSDGGVIDAGTVTDAGAFIPLPLLSQLVSVTTGVPGISPEIPVGGFSARRVDMVAIDSARQFIALEQETQLFGHFTSRRGKELINDTGSASAIDPAGSRAKLAYVPESDTVFACYNFGRGVRIRRSHDQGKTWGTDAVTLAPEEDGGFSSRFFDCSIAPWKNGGAIFAYIEDDSVVVRTVSEALTVPPLTASDYAFVSSPADAGNIFSPQHTAIATLPGPRLDGGSGSVVHVGFTGTRAVGAGSDTEIYGLYSQGSSGTFLGPELINQSATGGSGDPQDFVTLTVDPRTGRGLAAYSTFELGAYSSVYVSLFVPTAAAGKKWVTGSDLTVFAKKQTEYPVFPARQVADVWDAFSPSLTATKNGKLFLSVVAGKRNGTVRDLRMYLVGFDFATTSPIGGLGWFLPPAVKLSDTRVLDPRPASGVVPPNVSAICTDTQLSVYGTFIQGIGAMSEVENTAIFVSRP